jgi:hypothetical protein
LGGLTFHVAQWRVIGLIPFVLIPLFFDFLSQFLKVLSKAAPRAAAGYPGQSDKKEADTLEIVHVRVSTGRVMGENEYLTTRTFAAQGHFS